MAALVDALHQRVAHVEHGLLAPAALHRVAPDCALLRREARGRVRRDRSVPQVIVLVARGLDAVAGEHRVIDAHAAGGAVFDDKVGVARENGIEPREIGALMTEQTVADAVRVQLGADARLDVVVHLDVADVVVADQTVDDLVRVLDNLGIAEIELPAAAVVHLFAVAGEEPVGVDARGLRAADAHDLDLEPHAGDHALRADVVHDFLEAVREALVAREPLADIVPPEARGVPARVHAEVFAAGLVRGVDQRELLRGRRVRPQAVHVVVEDDAELFIVVVLAADHTAVFRQLAHRVVEFADRGADAHRHGCKRLTGLEVFPPVRFRLGRAAELDVEAAYLVADLPVPRAVVLDLPEEVGAGFRVFEQAHRQVFLGGPVSDIRRADHLGGALDLRGLALREAELGEAVTLPLHFALPAVVRVPDAHLVVGGEQALLFDAGQSEGGDVLEPLRLLADVLHVRPAAHGLNAVVKLHM